MRIARSIGLAIGIVCVLGTGLASFSRAQQTKEATGEPRQSKSDVCVRLLQLRTEVEILQLGYDATVRRLNEKKLDLAEAERVYQHEVQ
jgi:hypothetical protein